MVRVVMRARMTQIQENIRGAFGLAKSTKSNKVRGGADLIQVFPTHPTRSATNSREAAEGFMWARV